MCFEPVVRSPSWCCVDENIEAPPLPPTRSAFILLMSQREKKKHGLTTREVHRLLVAGWRATLKLCGEKHFSKDGPTFYRQRLCFPGYIRMPRKTLDSVSAGKPITICPNHKQWSTRLHCALTGQSRLKSLLLTFLSC